MLDYHRLATYVEIRLQTLIDETMQDSIIYSALDKAKLSPLNSSWRNLLGDTLIDIGTRLNFRPRHQNLSA